ncbi:MAG: NUDIX domain-containing protein [Treponema sp.]|jgi:predicted NUDIX family phosphoesterase|nr:NUDIX domain-containing protein [Treponema sp.]
MKICCVDTIKLPVEWTAGTAARAVDFFSFVSAADIRWVERSEAETNSAYKQIIPYIVVLQNSGRILCYPRHGAESRLHGFYSCGLGGHIDLDDARDTFEKTVSACLTRELKEELANFREDGVELVYRGIINETESAVGQVHLGLVYTALCADGYAPQPSEETAGMEWKTPEELKLVKKELWSDLALEIISAPS